MTNSEFAAALCFMADVFARTEEAKQPYESTLSQITIFCHSPEEWHDNVRLFGPGVKDADADGLIFRPNKIPFLRIYGFKHNICERVVLGKRKIETRIIPAQIIDGYEEEIVEFRCHPFTLKNTNHTTNEEAKNPSTGGAIDGTYQPQAGPGTVVKSAASSPAGNSEGVAEWI